MDAQERPGGPAAEDETAETAASEFTADAADDPGAGDGNPLGQFDQLLNLLGIGADERISISHQRVQIGEVKMPFEGSVYLRSQAVAQAAQYSRSENVWFGVNPISSTVQYGRGGNDDVTRLVALYGDFDIKQSGAGTREMIDTLIGEVSTQLTRHPGALVDSGNGVHAYWLLDPTDPAWTLDTDEKRAAAKTILARFHLLQAMIAERHSVAIDKVCDLARVLRVPGSFNRKVPTDPRPVTLTALPFGEVEMLTYDALAGVLDAAGVPQDGRATRSNQGGAPTPPSEPTSGTGARTGLRWHEAAQRVAGGDRYVYAAVLDELSKLAETRSGGRNNALNTAALKLASLPGINLDVLESVLIETCEVNGLIEDDGIASVYATIISAYRAADAAGQRTTPTSQSGAGTSGGDPSDPYRIDTSGFWSARPELEHIQAVARTRMISKWALLGVDLARNLASTSPDVVLAPIIGSVGSLNSIVALVGPSNSGKNTAVDVEAETIHRDGNQPPVLPIGSGEGIVCTFRPRGTKPDAPNAVDRAVFTAMEVDTLTAVSGRQGSTLSPVLRELFNGALIGFANSGRDTRVIVEAHSYRACVILGVQPRRAEALLAGADGGLPQRILWMPAWDPSLQDVPPARVQTWSVPPLSLDMFAGQHQMCVPDSVVAEIRRDRLRAARGLDQGDQLDGHSNFVRLKVAAALAIHAGRADINEEDWQLAGVIMDVSKATRTMCLDELSRQHRGSNHARAMDAAYRDEVSADHKHQRALGSLRRKLSDGQPHDSSALRRGLKADIRDCFEAAIDELVDSEEVVHHVERRRNRQVHVYQRYTPKKHTATSDDEACTESTRVPTPADVAARTGHQRRQRTRGKNRREHSTPAESD